MVSQTGTGTYDMYTKEQVALLLPTFRSLSLYFLR
jgi:hypothetical protein